MATPPKSSRILAQNCTVQISTDGGDTFTDIGSTADWEHFAKVTQYSADEIAEFARALLQLQTRESLPIAHAELTRITYEPQRLPTYSPPAHVARFANARRYRK